MQMDEIKEELLEILRWNQMGKDELCDEINRRAELHRLVGEAYEDADPDEMTDAEFYWLKSSSTAVAIQELLRRIG